MTTTDLTDSLAAAVALHEEGGRLVGTVHDGWDVFGIPHGGYLAAIAGSAVLTASGAPDIFTITTHYLRKAAVGPIEVELAPVGASRRFATWAGTGVQEGRVVLSIMASVGDRSAIDGPAWTARPAPDIPEDRLTPEAGQPGLPLQPPAVAHRLGLRLDTATTGFTTGDVGSHGRIQGRLRPSPGEAADQLLALVACDVTPPAAWNALGPSGWVPTVELTAHLRARPADGPMTVVAESTQVAGGFLEEDAHVWDATGALVAQSRQLARWSSPNPS